MAARISLQTNLGSDNPSWLLYSLQKRSESLGPVLTQGKEITHGIKTASQNDILESSCCIDSDLGTHMLVTCIFFWMHQIYMTVLKSNIFAYFLLESDKNKCQL